VVEVDDFNDHKHKFEPRITWRSWTLKAKCMKQDFQKKKV
jgi:hypothetical protein